MPSNNDISAKFANKLIAIRKEKGVVLDHAVNNMKVLLPLIWERLTKEDRWKIGRLYRDVATDGMVTAAAGVKSALSLVRGFDYVPEDLRSNTFIAHAQKVIDTHFSMYNFYNEPKAVRELAQLGEIIPEPAPISKKLSPLHFMAS